VTHVISYPKAGRTWLRLLLGKLFQVHYDIRLTHRSDLLEIQRFRESDARVPCMQFTHDDNAHLKSVSELKYDGAKYRHLSVVFLSRDPRDVVVSMYFQLSVREATLQDNSVFQGSLSEFLRDKIHGIGKVIAFMNVWARNRRIPKQFMLLRYEDMIEDAEREIWRVLFFLGVADVSVEVVRQVVEYASFDNMQRKERSGVLGPRLRATDPDDPESYKVRRGKVGGYVDYLSPGDIEYADCAMEMLDSFFGYGESR